MVSSVVSDLAGARIATVGHYQECAALSRLPATGIASSEELPSGPSRSLSINGNQLMGRTAMAYRSLLALAAVAAALASSASAQILDYGKYPDLKGQWLPIGGPGRFDMSKAWGPGQEAPLTPEYQAIFEANLADQAAGGLGYDRDFVCQSPGMPRVTNGYGEIEFVITPDTTYVMTQHIHDNRRIFTDGRDWPANLEPAFLGYSIGTWVDTTGGGRYDHLQVETRGPFKGPRAYDTSGLPLHQDNQTIVKEDIFLDHADREVAHDEVTVFDHALTRPWIVMKNYRRVSSRQPYWREINCAENNNHLEIGKQPYMLSADGYLMPTKRDQPAPDLRYFKPAPK
jgi:hypothetical protein